MTVLALIGAAFAVVAVWILNHLLNLELQSWLLQVPRLILKRLRHQVSPEFYDECYQKYWQPDLEAILLDESRGVLTRFAQGFRHAFNLWWTRGGKRSAETSVAESLRALEGFGDLRVLSKAKRKEFGKVVDDLVTALQWCNRNLDPGTAVQLLHCVASVCDAFIDDRNERAAEYLALAAAPLMAQLPTDEPAVLAMRLVCARAQLQLGRTEHAGASLEALLQDNRRVFGSTHQETVKTRRLLAWAKVGEGRYAEAEVEFRDLLADLPLRSSPIRGHLECQLSWAISGQPGRLFQAIESYDRVIAFRTRELGQLHPDTLDTRHSKGKMLVLHQEGDMARRILQPLLADRIRVCGSQHPDTLETRKYLAIAIALDRNRFSPARLRALHRIRRVQRAQQALHGSDHPHTRDTVTRIAELESAGWRQFAR